MAASRYRLVDDAEMERLLHAKESKNTRRVMTSAVDSFRHFLLTKGLYQKFESFDIEMLDARLAKFYASVQRGDAPMRSSAESRENLRQMTKSTFKVDQDDTWKRYVYQSADELGKNHRENSTNNNTEGRMYKIPGSRNCPVFSFELYISKLNPNCEALWQKPKDSLSASDVIWHCNSPLGKKSLSKMMSQINKIGN
ncbi:hypothetical protein KUTeg_003202 [Tegillarca granosa]|uniref:ZMYM2-like/QRICH1 C-terminal domain-containing protein n=1 Tax=Tegillarca granosa TaxID=220873 RepID=A0ABQ9FLE4_TEGGR|nr:hypothetical protein KUTeg_003202 [Tegillarca granosa]